MDNSLHWLARSVLLTVMEKIPCTECGALILPSTAETTAGVCMACKQGIRQNIERSKAYYQKQKEYDPSSALWRALVKRVYSAPEGFESLTEDEKTYFAISLLDGEVYNGGMHQFFSNSSGEFYQEAFEGLSKIGASTSLTLLSEATRILFGDVIPPKDRSERWAKIRQYPEADNAPVPEWSLALERIDRQFSSDPDRRRDLLRKFAETKGLLAPFVKKSG